MKKIKGVQNKKKKYMTQYINIVSLKFSTLTATVAFAAVSQSPTCAQ